MASFVGYPRPVGMWRRGALVPVASVCGNAARGRCRGQSTLRDEVMSCFRPTGVHLGILDLPNTGTR